MRHPMASTTKIMTALIAIEKSNLDEIVSVNPMAVGIEGSSVYLQSGEEISMENLLYALLLQSANDAATQIAIHIGGSIEEFCNMMNERAKSLGLNDTHFTNPHGLDNENHYTSAHDLTIIAATAMEDETFREIVSCKQKTIKTNTPDGEITRVLVNHNKLLRIYDGAVGVKTGYTKKTGRCLVSAASRDNVNFICVTLDAPNDWDDHSKLLDYAFSRFSRHIIAKEKEIYFDIPLLNGNTDKIAVANLNEMSCVVCDNDCSVILKTDINGPLIAPIRAGDAVGYIYAYRNGIKVASSPLIVLDNVNDRK